mmetsp:Transcript_27090/g.36887  ORF Transcript_27090/g.36887 Transcript_27090/m.36887 type:complete len:205 (-) Transcript_27090:669-1283(-)
MFTTSNLRFSLTKFADRVNQLNSVHELSTAITLITTGIFIVAHIALTTNKSVGQKEFAFRAVLLFSIFLFGVTLLFQFVKNILSNLGLDRSSRTTKHVEVAVKPVIDFFVNLVVVVADFLRSFAFFHSLGYSCSSVFISTANINGVVSHQTGETSIYISRQNTSNNVTQMRNIVDVWESTCNQDVSLTFYWKNLTINYALDFSI